MARNRLVLFVVAVIFVSPSAVHGAVTVGGGVSDWGVTISSGNFVYTGWIGSSAWVNPITGEKYKDQAGTTPGWNEGGQQAVYQNVAPSSPTALQPTYWGIAGIVNGEIQYLVEDTRDTSNHYYVGPVYGGQNFDAEFLAVLPVASGTPDAKLYLAIGTGQRSDNGPAYFQPGDIQLVTQNSQTGKWSIYGIEVGGGGGAGSAGKTFNLNSSGYASTVTTFTSGQVAGTLWRTATDLADYAAVQSSTAGWRTGYGSTIGFDPYKRVQLDNPSTLLGTVEFDYQAAPNGHEHAWIEAGISLAQYLPQSEQVKYVGWAPSCANDHTYMMLQLGSSTGGPPIPEPASLSIWSLFGGAAAFAASRRRRSTPPGPPTPRPA